jgi:hypothetical protein
MGETALRFLLVLAAGVAGTLLARRSLKAATAAGAVLLGLILLKVAVGYIPAAEAGLFPWDFYPRVERWWYEVPAFGLFGIGLWTVRASLIKRDALLVLGGLLLARVLVVTASTWAQLPSLAGQVGEDGICRQTTGFTCAAAASAMYLDRLGVRATEAEMAEACATGWDGTTDAGIARGLRRKLAGHQVRVSAPAYEDLRAPALVSILLQNNISHSVLLEAAGPEGVRLADPLGSRRRMSREAFLSRWQRSSIRAE